MGAIEAEWLITKGQDAALNSLVEELQKDNRFEVESLEVSYNNLESSGTKSEDISWSEIKSICKKHNVDAIGLSGLITPSLDEMAYMAEEMEKNEMTIPLLIGGATTSKAHTVVKISPKYNNTVVHINDASRAVTVVGNLLDKNNEDFKTQIKEDYDAFRENFLSRKKAKEYTKLEEARERKFKIDWKESNITKPKKLGVTIIEDFDLSLLKDFIDWSPYFRSWELHGKYPDILTDAVVGEQATVIFKEAQILLQRIFDEKLLNLR